MYSPLPYEEESRTGHANCPGTMVGFFGDLCDSPVASYHTSGIISFYFNPRVYVRATRAVSCVLSRFKHTHHRHRTMRMSEFRNDLFCRVEFEIKM